MIDLPCQHLILFSCVANLDILVKLRCKFNIDIICSRERIPKMLCSYRSNGITLVVPATDFQIAS